MKTTRPNVQIDDLPDMSLPGQAYFRLKYAAWLKRRGLNEANEGFARGRGWRSRNRKQKV